MPDQENYRPIKRIRQACQNCRRKKARCTGERPECAFCIRLGQYCTYSDDEVESTSAANSTSSGRKVEVARTNCVNKDLLHRISALENQMFEVIQTVKGIESNVTNSLTQLTKNMSDSEILNSVGGDLNTRNGDLLTLGPYHRLPPPEIIHAAADLYFRYCHNQPYSLFHEITFRRRLEFNEIPAHLLFALLASTARYSTDPFFTDKNVAVFEYAQQAWNSIVLPWNGIQSGAEISTVQTILLLAIIDYTDGRTQGSWIKVGLAIRLAQDFRLMVEPDDDLLPIQQEERRRVFWSFYLCDKLISCGRERPAVILDDHCKLRLPCDENDWRTGHPGRTLALDELFLDRAVPSSVPLSSFATTIIMASLLSHCAKYALGEQEEHMPSGQMLPPWSPLSRFSSIQSVLLQHETQLGLSGNISEKLALICTAPDGLIDQHQAAPLVLSHALFFLCQCLLYHPLLIKQRLARAGQRTSQSFLSQSFACCRLAATSMSRLMDDVKYLCCETLDTTYDPFYGYCSIVAGTIHSLFYQSADPIIRDIAYASFETSINNLKEMSFYWKSCEMMRARLEDFHANSTRYTSLIDPAIEEVDLSKMDANDLIECLDYARISATSRRKSQDIANHLSAVSQQTTPFFDEPATLHPLGSSEGGSAVLYGSSVFTGLQKPPFGSSDMGNCDPNVNQFSTAALSLPQQGSIPIGTTRHE